MLNYIENKAPKSTNIKMPIMITNKSGAAAELIMLELKT